MEYYYPPGLGEPVLKSINRRGYQSAAMILNPFISIPNDRIERGYPRVEEEILFGKPIKWRNIMETCGFNNYKEVALAWKLDIFGSPFIEEQIPLNKKLKENLPHDYYSANSDAVSPFVLDSFIKNLRKRGDQRIKYYSFIGDRTGEYLLNDIDLEAKKVLCDQPITIFNDDESIVLTCYPDNVYSLLLSKEQNIEEIIKEMGVEEVIICDESTVLDWMFH